MHVCVDLASGAASSNTGIAGDHRRILLDIVRRNWGIYTTLCVQYLVLFPIVPSNSSSRINWKAPLLGNRWTCHLGRSAGSHAERSHVRAYTTQTGITLVRTVVQIWTRRIALRAVSVNQPVAYYIRHVTRDQQLQDATLSHHVHSFMVSHRHPTVSKLFATVFYGTLTNFYGYPKASHCILNMYPTDSRQISTVPR